MIDYPNWFGILAWMPYLLLGIVVYLMKKK